ncbi:alanine racemase [Pigmentiphaga litoralis]|uniref:alanine racemase n=1 Tax=Pigmentiphaga litoralis TaxID=516702 RepID=UPI003B4334F2
MPRPIYATVSRSALAHNLATVRQHLARVPAVAAGAAGGGAGAAAGAAAGASTGAGASTLAPPRIWAVIKANAYGHGIERAMAGFSNADGLAMLDLAEAVRCREAGWVGPILLLEGVFEPADLDIVGRYHLTIAVTTDEHLDMIEHARFARPVDVFLKLNSGMNRLGFVPSAYRAAFQRLSDFAQRGKIGTVGHMTHFSTADGPAGIANQLAVFRDVTSGLRGPVSLCNSAASLRFPEVAADWVRPGIALYGSTPFDDRSAESYGLKPAMALRSTLIGTQDVPAGGSVGYGAAFRATTAMRIGVVACGYADGYPRHAGTGTPVVVGGVRTRLVGRVSMDMLAVDLTPVPGARVGTPVTLWGADGLSVDEVAQAAGTIGYELLCAVAPRVAIRSEA